MNLKDKIHTIRGKQVILDRDLAELYGIKAYRLREQVKRNKKRFPKDFMFQLTEDETIFMVSQNAIPSKKHLGGTNPYVFTEQGVANLSSVLNNDKAIEINIQIMRAFVTMRKFLSKNAAIFQRLDKVETKLIEHDKNFEKVFDAMQDKLPEKGIFYDGQVYDAYNFITSLIKQAKESIILIDNYIDTSTITLFSEKNKNVNVTIYTKEISEKLKLAEEKFNKQYNNLEIKPFNKSHDRFLIIDNTTYHIGASLKDLGKKWTAFSKLELNILPKLEL